MYAISSICKKGDEKVMTTITQNYKVKVWSVQGSDPSQWALIKDLGQHDGYVNAAAWSPDGTKVVTGGGVGADRGVVSGG